MKKVLQNLLNDESGQDLMEYTLLVAFVALSSTAIFVNAGSSLEGMWGMANTQLASANANAS